MWDSCLNSEVMCLQCVTEPDNYGEIVPGFYLMKSTKGSPDEWEAEIFALVEINDPTYYLDNIPAPICDPMFELTEGEEEKARSNPEIDMQEDLFIEQMHIMMDNLCGRPISGYRLYKSCLDSGYSMEKHCPLESWLLHKIAERINTTTPERWNDDFPQENQEPQ